MLVSEIRDARKTGMLVSVSVLRFTDTNYECYCAGVGFSDTQNPSVGVGRS